MTGGAERNRLTRRSFLAGTAAAAALTALPPTARAAPGKTVAVFGAGIAGLTAAHELVDRGYSVTVYERKALGGKARSIPVPNSGATPLPAEHGFRFFPGFYRNVTDTMRRIPFPGNANGTWAEPDSGDVVPAFRDGTLRPDCAAAVSVADVAESDHAQGVHRVGDDGLRDAVPATAMGGRVRGAEAGRLRHQQQRAQARPVGEHDVGGLYRREQEVRRVQPLSGRWHHSESRRIEIP